MKKVASMTALWCLAVVSSAQGVDNMKAFPPAEERMTRHVLNLPPRENELAFQVELLVGKTVAVDAVNQYFFAGKIEEKTIEGWGFPRFVVEKLGPMAGTLIGVDPNAPKVERFIAIGGGPFLVRYNSRLPLVVYVPEGVEVRYRIWSASPEAKPIGKG